MSSRKRPLVEVSQPHSAPARYGPSTPHAIRAIQQRSGAKARSVRSVRQADGDVVRPNSIRGVLKQFAKISAPVTKKRVLTPSGADAEKENRLPDEYGQDDDSFLLNKPYLTFAISESIEEDDSEIPVAPTPSVLPDEDYEQPTITFQNVSRIPLARPASEHSDRRQSRPSFLHSEPTHADDQDGGEGDMTIMTERGRRAISEEATGRFSRYSFGSIRMSGFGSDLEIRRDSHGPEKTLGLDLDDYVPVQADDIFDGDETEDIRRLRRSFSSDAEDDTVHLSTVNDETFALALPADEVSREAAASEAHTSFHKHSEIVASNPRPQSLDENDQEDSTGDPKLHNTETSSGRQTILETAVSNTQALRRKRVKLTRHGNMVPSLPASLVKRVVLDSYESQSRRKPQLGKEHMKALEQATEWFFEQAGEDLAAYSSHGRRKKRIDASDVLLLMRRQKVLFEDGELRRLAKSWLPKDVLEGLDLPDTV